MRKANDRRVRIACTDKLVTFTQRGRDPQVGFIRRHGRTITGEVENMSNFDNSKTELVFWPRGANLFSAY